MIKVSVDNFLRRMTDEKYHILVNGELNIVGFRNRFGRPNYFDDCIAVYQNIKEGWVVSHYPATTLPGTPYLIKPVNKKGSAILVPGQYIRAYELGLHKGKYTALVQVASVKVYRDNTKDAQCDVIASTIDEGLFGINIHRASLQTHIVGADSAGCQVIQNKADYDELISKCKAQVYKRFSYTLIEL